MSLWARALAAAAAGAVVAALCLTVVASVRPGLAFEMNGPPPAIGRGFYSPERDGDVSLAWTAGEASLSPAGLARAAAWQCAIRFRSGRPAETPRATLVVTVDGAPVASAPAADTFQDLAFGIPAAGRSGADIAFMSRPVFTPGTADTRELGVQVDRISCAPTSVWMWPPAGVMRDVAAVAAIFAFVFVAAAGSVAGAIAVGFFASLGAALLLTLGAAQFTDYSPLVLRSGLGIAAGFGALMVSLQLARGQRLSPWARFAIATAGVALFLKVIGLLHPAKPLIDAMFHAHRLEWVMAGTWRFTQPFVGGVEMPYAIGLYVFGLPWMWTTSDHVALIRILTATVDVAACLLLYPVILRVWGDRRAAAAAVLATQVAPLPFVILGNANLANLFGQSVALVTMAVAIALPVELRRVGSWLLFVAVLTWALCSHVSTATTLACTLAVLTLIYFFAGDAGLRRRAIGIGAGLASAAVAAWVIYYRHFLAEFRAAFARMFAEAPAGTDPAGAAATAAATAEGYMTTGERVWNLIEQAITSAGLPLLILAVIGLVATARRRERDPLTLALTAWAVVWLVFSASTVFARVDAEYVRYAAEFLGRINLATIPLLAVLAGRGAAWAWSTEAVRGQAIAKLAVAALIVWVVVLGAGEWIGWFER